MRAVAVLLVVVYHVWLGRVSGGVDVFLMLSAYFLTGAFLRRIEDGRPSGVRDFWVRRFFALVPAAAVTLLGILIVVWAFYPSSHWNTIWSQTWASLFYMQNWELAQSAVDYYDRGVPLSPVQHFWSLSVQGQVFILWPLLLVSAGFVVRRSGISARAALTAVFGGIAVLSLVYAAITTVESPQFAYFDTIARLWEFAFGSLLAVWADRLVVRGSWGAALGWLGLLLLVVCGAVFDSGAASSIALAACAVAAACAVMIGGASSPPGGPTSLLSAAPVQFLSKIAYALYLVHWPILITWMLVQGRTEVGVLSGLAVIGLSVLIASAITFGIELPLRAAQRLHTRARLQGRVIVASAALVAVPLAAWQISDVVALTVADESSAYPGARILGNMGSADRQFLNDAPAMEIGMTDIRPTGSELPTEWVTLPLSCEGTFAPTDPLVAENCMQTPVSLVPQPVVMIIGDSHAQQWMGALAPIAQREGWQLIAVLRGGCHLGLDRPGLGDPEACDQWRSAALSYAESVSPDAVMTIGTAARVESPEEDVPDGLEKALRALTRTGANVVTLRDNPRFEENVFGCIERNGPAAIACAHSKSDVLADSDPGAALSRLPGVDHLDLTDLLCPGGECVPVIGNVAVYRDDNHLTARYAQSMAGALEDRLRATDWWRTVN